MKQALLVVAGIAFCAAPSTAAPLASCGESALELAASPGGAGELRALVASPAGRWRFVASVALARVGGRTRTLTVENLRGVEGQAKRGSSASPSQLFIDLLLDDQRITLRHASEGGDDPEIRIDLARCSFPAGGDVVLATLIPLSKESLGCAPATVRDEFLPAVRRAVASRKTAAPVDAEHAAQALCESHQATIAARNRLEQTVADTAAHLRTRARGLALVQSEDALPKALRLVDGCLSRARSDPPLTVAALEAGEARTRACYEEVIGKIASVAPAR